MVLLLASLFSFTLFASEVSGLNTFQAGEKALASEVNDNFTAVSDAVADNDTRITANATAIQTNSSAVANKMTKNVGTCDPGTAIREIKTDGAVTCEAINAGVSTITEGAGISVTQPALGSVTVSVADGGISNSMMANDSVGSSEIIGDAVESSIHIKDEAGISSIGRGCLTQILGVCKTTTLVTKSPVNVASVDINVPNIGYVLVTFSASYTIDHTNGVTDTLRLELNTSTAADVCLISPFVKGESCNESHRLKTIIDNQPAGVYVGSIQTQMRFKVKAAGVNTYFLDAKSSKDTGITIGEYSMNVMYFPTSY